MAAKLSVDDVVAYSANHRYCIRLWSAFSWTVIFLVLLGISVVMPTLRTVIGWFLIMVIVGICVELARTGRLLIRQRQGKYGYTPVEAIWVLRDLAHLCGISPDDPVVQEVVALKAKDLRTHLEGRPKSAAAAPS